MKFDLKIILDKNSGVPAKKIIKSENYNMIFDYKDGMMYRWGKEKEDDPEMCIGGPEIADIEISTICSGPKGIPCDICYKSNTKIGKNMSFDTFKCIFDKLPPTVSQIAFGVGDIDANPDLFKIMEYCRKYEDNKNYVVPNVTINGSRLNKHIIGELSRLCGAIAVSHYDDDLCFNAVKILKEENKNLQINIHKVLSEETYEDCMRLLDVSTNDSRLKGNLNAIVFLLLKPKGSRNKNNTLSDNRKFKEIISYSLKNKINIGFDSCSAIKYINSISELDFLEKDQKQDLINLCEPCESTLFSIYINVDGIVYPCSFCEDICEGINFIDKDLSFYDIWLENENVVDFRKELLRNGRKCPKFIL